MNATAPIRKLGLCSYRENLQQDYCPAAHDRLQELSPGLDVEEGHISPLGISAPSQDSLRIEQICSTIISVKGSEFLRRLKSLARRERLVYRWRPERGVGSHGTVYLGDRFTVVKDPKKELGPGLLSDMCKQLGIRKEDL